VIGYELDNPGSIPERRKVLLSSDCHKILKNYGPTKKVFLSSTENGSEDEIDNTQY
jgi:hypothetical protein